MSMNKLNSKIEFHAYNYNQNGIFFALNLISLPNLYAADRRALIDLVDKGAYFGQVIGCRESSVVAEMEGSTN